MIFFKSVGYSLINPAHVVLIDANHVAQLTCGKKLTLMGKEDTYGNWRPLQISLDVTVKG